MFIATRGGNIKVVQTLLQFGADKTIAVNEKTPLDLARSLNYPQIVALLSGDKVDISSNYQSRRRYQKHNTPSISSLNVGKTHASMQFTMGDLELLKKMETKYEDKQNWFARAASPAKRTNVISLGSRRSQDSM